MADVSLNLSAKGTALFRAPEQGWLTGEAWALTAHEGRLPTSTKDDVLPMGTTAHVNDINSYDLVFVYADGNNLTVSRDGRRGQSGPRAAFASFNNMDVNRKCSFLGCATTQYIANTGVDAIFSITMSGIVTVDCTSYHAFKDGDLVAWQVPAFDPAGGEKAVAYPYHPKDDPQGRLRCVLYPVTNRNPGMAHRVANEAIRRAMALIRRAVGSNPRTTVHDAAIDQLARFDKKSAMITHLNGVLNKGHAMHPQTTQGILGSDMWATLSTLAKQSRPVPGKQGHLSKETAYTIAAMGYLACTAVLRRATYPDSAGNPQIKLEDINGRTVTDQTTRELIAAELEANLLFTMIRFAGYIDEFDVSFAKHQIVGLCVRACPAGAVVNLDIWLGRKI